jgi:hypothetical protein
MRRTSVRLLLAAPLTLLLALVTAGVAFLGMGQYSEDLCISVSNPGGSATETSVTGPHWSGLTEYRCDFAGQGSVYVHDSAPVFWFGGLVLAFVTVVGVGWWLVFRHSRRPTIG